MAIVGGANLMFNPDMFMAMSSMTSVPLPTTNARFADDGTD